VQKKKRKATTCSACRHHKNCDVEHKIEGHGRIVFCLCFCKSSGGIEKRLPQKFMSKSIIAKIVNFLMTILFPVNAKRVMGKWRIFIEFAKIFNSEKK
jgi:hypothetical protein